MLQFMGLPQEPGRPSGPAVRQCRNLTSSSSGCLSGWRVLGCPRPHKPRPPARPSIFTPLSHRSPSPRRRGGLPGLLLRATFSLLDANGTIMKSDIENATLRLGGDVYSSKFSKLETDWSVVLLVDTSGTMSIGRAFTDFRGLRDSLTRSLASAPDNASFALIPFSDRAPDVGRIHPRPREAR